MNAPRSVIAAVAVATLCVAGCSDDGAAPPPPAPQSPAPNQSPVAEAGADQSVVEGDAVMLDGTASYDSDGAIVAYAWMQTAGPGVVLSDAAAAAPSFQAPDVATDAVLTFSLRVEDNDGATASDTVDISVAASGIRVFAKAGVVEGEALPSGVVVFRSVPYAEPPVGALRWRAPQALDRYDGVRETKTFRSNCWQLANPYAPGDSDADDVSEDCLYLNIWTPAPDPEAGAPVMFWIHGGGNIAGTPDKPLYDGETFARDHGVVLVSVKYRLGPLGYLAHRDLNAEGAAGTSGNYGLLDIIAALEWTKENIDIFGGDPDAVAIFGESGGAVNVCNMIVSPLAAGLFEKAIMESGPCEAPVQDLYVATARSDESALETGDRAAVALGCAGAADVVSCMRDVEADDLFAALDPAADRFFDDGDVYQPITDGYVLPQAPLDIIAAGAHNRTPLLIGSNADEATLWKAPIEALITGPAAYELIVEEIYDDDPDLIPNGPSADILAAYPASTEEEAEEAFMRLFTDANFTCTTRRAARAMAAHVEPVWRYEFTRTPFALRDYGAFHGAELPYVFNTFDGGVYTDVDEALGEDMRAYWVNFARAGDPNGGTLPVWPRYFETSDEHMILDDPLATGARLRESYCDLIDSLR